MAELYTGTKVIVCSVFLLLLSVPLGLVRPICDIFISLLASPHPSHQYLLPSAASESFTPTSLRKL
jgi:hypothetical protein